MTARHLEQHVQRLQHWVLSTPEEPLPPRRAVLHKVARVVYAVGRDLVAGQLNLHAMSLVYTTLLSIVPLLALSFSVLKALGVHNELEPLLLHFFEPLGARGDDIAREMLGFVDNIKVGVLGSLGLAMLVYTVVSLVQKVELSFNMIWQTSQLRPPSQRFSNYLSVILIGPLLMVSAMGITATILSSSLMQSVMAIAPLGQLLAFAGQLMPLLLVIMAFTFVYVFIPNTRVQLSCALLGGVVAGIVWQAAGVLFASFVVGSVQYEAIYSSFAIGIILLIWSYVSWLILLVGSSIAYYAQHESTITRRREAVSSAELEERVGLLLVCQVATVFDRGGDLPGQEALARVMRIPARITCRLCDKLIRRGILMVGGPDGDRLLPGRSLDQLRVSDVLSAIRADEDGLIDRLPALPAGAMVVSENPVTLAELIRR